MACEARAGELDALGAVLPAGSADRLAGLLTDADVATLRHVAERGMGANTLRALASDLGYLEAWCSAATGAALPWPAPLDLALKFVAQHLWDPSEQDRDPEHGMPAAVRAELTARGVLRKAGPHAPATVRRRLASWATLTAWRGLEGPFGDPALKKALRLAVRGQDRGRHRHSAEAVTKPVMDALIAPVDDIADVPLPRDHVRHAAILRASRDRALLSVAFAAGGRRRAEIAGLHMERIAWRAPTEDAPDTPLARIALGRTKTTDAGDGAAVTVAGRAGGDLKSWLNRAEIVEGPVFRRLDRWGNIGAQAITPQSVNLILKQRLADAGFEPAAYSAHGLRAGFLTEAALQGLSLPEAMAQSGHRSAQQAAEYYSAGESEGSRAARLLD